MNCKCILLLLFCALAVTHGAEEPYAELWEKGTDSEKKIFLSGISIGLNLMTRYSQQTFKLSGDSTVADSLCVTGVENHLLKVYRELHFMERGMGEGVVVKMIDALYKKEKNRNLSFQEVYLAALTELGKKSLSSGSKGSGQ